MYSLFRIVHIKFIKNELIKYLQIIIKSEDFIKINELLIIVILLPFIKLIIDTVVIYEEIAFLFDCLCYNVLRMIS